MRTIKLSRASRTLAEYAAELTDEIVVLTERNKPIAAIVPLKGFDRESLALSGHPEFLKLIARSRGEFRRGQTVSLADMKRVVSAGRSPHGRVQPTGAPRKLRGGAKAVKRRARG